MKLRYLSKENLTPTIAMFWFEPLEAIQWQAGQSIRLELRTPYGSDERRFTISSPLSATRLAITTKLSESQYKQALFSLEPGSLVQGFAIEGSFIWRDAAQPHLWIAGGLGITPFYAMLRVRSEANLPLAAKLIYLARVEEHLFKREFAQWQSKGEFSCVTLTDSSFLTKQLSSLPYLADQQVYLSGPNSFVTSIYRDWVVPRAVPPSHLLIDWFTGYK